MLTKKQLQDATRCSTRRACSVCSLDKITESVYDCRQQCAKTALAYREMLERLEWGAIDGTCPCCGNFEKHGHAPDCELAKLLKEGE